MSNAQASSQGQGETSKICPQLKIDQANVLLDDEGIFRVEIKVEKSCFFTKPSTKKAQGE
jgi:hypothetical protein